MVQAEVVKDLIKPPFANYDVVVYFGCGIFFLPFLFHYIGEEHLRILSFDYHIKPDFAAVVVSSLSILFGVYILGHMIAYAGSQYVEKLMDSVFGKTSTVVFLGSKDDGGTNPMFQRQMRDWTKKTWEKSARFLVVRALAHVPVLIPYVGLYLFGAFGFYRTRVSKGVMDKAVSEFASRKLPGGPVCESEPWYKALEAYVMNNCPIATARMYNYLVIFGVFRSLCIVFLFSLWFELAYLFERLSAGTDHVGLFSLGYSGVPGLLLSYAILATLYIFSLFSYLKFQRRYVEEAIFAFVVTKI